MATLPTYFSDYLKNIRMTDSQVQECKTGHETLRKRLEEDENLGPIIVDTFLQGSYKRNTAIRPAGEKGKSDVDVIVVTTLDRATETPDAALERFKPFLKKWYDGKYRKQGRSWGIELSYVDLDLVVTSAPSEAAKSYYKNFAALDVMANECDDDSWKTEPLWIPDRDANQWEKTHPLAQILKTREKNHATNGHYINVVKAIKWWRKALHPKPKYPKSYPLEHLIWTTCPYSIDSVAEGVVSAFERIRDDYRWCVESGGKPYLPDHGVPEHDVFARVSAEDFKGFYALACDAAAKARSAYDEEDKEKSAEKWRELFGEKFPAPPKKKKSDEAGLEGYTPRTAPSIIGGGRYA